jgi:hypothetical protein
MITIIGIDPGSSGGIAHYKNSKAYAVKMPKKTNELNDYFKMLRSENESVIVFLEKVSHFLTGDDAPGKKFAIQKMMNSYQELKTLLQVNNLPYCEVHPATWQTNLLERRKGESKQDRKRRYSEFAKGKYPELKVTLSTSDALCIMTFGFNKVNYDTKWINERIVNYTSNKLF